ncbi:hypothetical protein K7432_014213 [Basidiobolus ranarum]|uniref:Thioredoxin domain-containing protein n=1 Tax=Basidiobolus ranarum TaxID=34480 RepID=A0ABR2VPS3_9FUNG
MHLLKTFFLLLSLRCAIALNLTPASFEDRVSTGIWFIQFYSPYCGYCRELAPLWNELDNRLSPQVEGKDFHLARLDCVEFKDFCDERGITAYPTLHLFNNGKQIDQFVGIRNYENFEQFLLPRIENPQTTAAEDSSLTTPPVQAAVDVLESQNIPINPEGKVVVLSTESFNQLTPNGPWFIKFFAPWCGHCKKVTPVWEELGERLKNVANVATVDCTQHEGLCKEHEIRGYPTLKFFQDGNSLSYSGSRSLEKLSDFAIKAANSKIEEVSANHLDYIKYGDVSFVYFHDSNSPGEYLAAVKSAARSLFMNSHFYTSSDPNMAKELEISQVPSLVVFKEDLRRKYEHDLSDKVALEKWISTQRFPLITQIESQNSEALLRSPYLIVAGVIDPASADAPQVLQTLHDAAKEYYKQGSTNPQDHVTFVWIDGILWSNYVSKVFSITKATLPSVILAYIKDDVYYDTDKQETRLLIEKDSILQAITAAQNGELTGKSTLDIFSRTSKNVYNFFSPVLTFFKNNPLAIVGILIVAIASTVFLVIKCIDETDEEHIKEE